MRARPRVSGTRSAISATSSSPPTRSATSASRATPISPPTSRPTRRLEGARVSARVSFMRLTPADLAKPADVSDDDARKHYDREIAHASRRPRQRQVAADRLQGSRRGRGGRGGARRRQDLRRPRRRAQAEAGGRRSRPRSPATRSSIPKVADAAFSLAAERRQRRDRRPVRPGDRPRHDGRAARWSRPSTRSRTQIKQEIADERAAAEIADQRDVDRGCARRRRHARRDRRQIRPEARHHPGDRQQRARTPTASRSPDLPGGKALLAAAFETDVGLENDPDRRSTSGYRLVRGDRRSPRRATASSPRSATRWSPPGRRPRSTKRLAAKANEIRDRLAKRRRHRQDRRRSRRSTVKTADKVTRAATPPAGDLSAAAVNAAFGGPKGTPPSPTATTEQPKIVLARHRRDRAALFLRRAGPRRRARSSSPRRSPTTSCRTTSASCRASSASRSTRPRSQQAIGVSPGCLNGPAPMLVEPARADFARTYDAGAAAGRLDAARRRPRDAGLGDAEALGRAAPTASCSNRSRAAPCAAAIRSSASSPT